MAFTFCSFLFTIFRCVKPGQFVQCVLVSKIASFMMVYSHKVLIHWKHAVTAIPGLKFLYVYSHHCSFIGYGQSNSCGYHNSVPVPGGTNYLVPTKEAKLQRLNQTSLQIAPSSNTDLLYLTSCKRQFFPIKCAKNAKLCQFLKQKSILETLLLGKSVAVPSFKLSTTNIVAKTNDDNKLLQQQFSDIEKKSSGKSTNSIFVKTIPMFLLSSHSLSFVQKFLAVS